MNSKINEQVYLLGKQHTLVAIMTRASGNAVASNQKPTVVILNTGIVHRVGHHRMFVALSRALAGIGFNVLRFDFAGIKGLTDFTHNSGFTVGVTYDTPSLFAPAK